MCACGAQLMDVHDLLVMIKLIKAFVLNHVYKNPMMETTKIQDCNLIDYSFKLSICTFRQFNGSQGDSWRYNLYYHQIVGNLNDLVERNPSSGIILKSHLITNKFLSGFLLV